MKKRVHFLSTNLGLTVAEQISLAEEVVERLREMGHDDDVIVLSHLHYEGTIE